MNKECVLVVLKPDVAAKGLMGNILDRFSGAGLELVAIKILSVSQDLAQAHYRHLKEQRFYSGIIKYLQGKLHGGHKAVALVYSGKNAVDRCRDIAGATNPEEADLQSVRGAMGRITTQGVFENLIHVSSDHKEALREIKLWFSPDEIDTDLFPTRDEVLKNYKKKVWK